MRLNNIIIFLCIICWPLSILTSNTINNSINYIIPALTLLVSFIFYRKKYKFYTLPILLIPFVQPKLAIFPLIFVFFEMMSRKSKLNYTILIFALIIFMFKWQAFIGQTIFMPDYEAKQEIIRKTQLYDSIIFARTFHNKARIIIDKFNYNFFSLIDPNNYFFGFHPREIIGNQNLIKYPFLGAVFIFTGIYYLKKNKERKFLILSSISSLISLSLLNIFDRNDFILWFPLSLLLIDGVNRFRKQFKYAVVYYTIFTIFSLIEIGRIFLLL